MNSLVILIVFFSAIAQISGLQIVQPYPKNYIVMEGESLSIPCSAADSGGFPTKVTFQKRTDDGSTFEEIKPNASIISISNTSLETSGLFTVTAMLYIYKIRYPEDGTSQGKEYKCWSSLGQTTKELTFRVYVIPKSDLPSGVVTGAVAQFGGPANLTCNITKSGKRNIQIKKVEWKKGNAVISQGVSDIAPIAIAKTTTRDGGMYTCVAEVELWGRIVQITMGTATLLVQLKMVEGETQVTGNVTKSVVMQCPAEGYPLNVTWFRVNRNGQEVKLSEVPRIKDRIVVSRSCSYCRYSVIVRDLQSHDAGHFVCRANTYVMSARHHISLDVRTEQNETKITSTLLPTTTTKGAPVPAKSTRTTMIIYITTGIVLGLSLLANAILIYKYCQNKKRSILEEDDNTTPENIEVVTVGEKRPSQLELQEINLDDEPKDTEEHPNTSDSAKMIEGGQTEKEPVVREIEGKCSSYCESAKPKNDQGKYTELPQNESTNSNTTAPTQPAGYCSVM